jgi:hypothetical protein
MGLMRVAARTAVISGTATAVSGRVAQRQMAAAQASAPAAAAPAGDASISKVQELAALHAQGVLSDEEFAAAKAKALGI